MKVLIIEDEKNAFLYLAKLLGRCCPEADIVDHLISVEGSINWFRNNPDPDLVLLDIQLSDGRSFEIFKHVEVQVPVIFTTAYDQYAIEAFKVNSIDYLLKPIHEDDLRASLDKLRSRDAFFAREQLAELQAIMGKMGNPKKNRCLVKRGSHYEFIKVADIAFAYSSDSITFLQTFSGERHIYDKTIESLHQMLDERNFFQINRSQILNIEAISKIHPFLNQRIKLDLHVEAGDAEFIVSRGKAADFRKWVDQ
ncbi:MAG: LytTR family DNA-binding domain-containing protein [Saprospiraceae bacterium]|nr:LytTR family DNA-binding domain-containing protein [Saprospiraceae bacterium]